MPRPKRDIKKPKKYQTTESSDDNENYENIEKYEFNKDEVQDKIENDIHSLSAVLLETQQILQNKDNENMSLSNRSELSKPCIRSDVMLDPSLKYHITTADSSYRGSQINKSKILDVTSHCYLPKNDDIVTLSPAFDVQHDTERLQFEPIYKPQARTEDNIRNATTTYSHNTQYVYNQHNDYLSDTRIDIAMKRYTQTGPEQLYFQSSHQSQTNTHYLQNITNIGKTNTCDNSDTDHNEKTRDMRKVAGMQNDTHSTIPSAMQNKDIGFASIVAADFRRLYTWMDKRFTNLEEIIQKSKTLRQKRKPWSKPCFLPFTNKEAVLQFNAVEETTYDEVVSYLKYVGGFSLKEALNLCIKETVQDDVMCSFTFYGNEEGLHSFFKTKLCSAIQEAISENKHFHIPTSAEFRQDMIEAIRNAKQRKRNSMNKNKENKGKRHLQEQEMLHIFQQRQRKHLQKE